jgi:saccharopine dehydrogenase-like NADP-dependent oxidoreductase
VSPSAHCVLVLGGYGFFGQRISAELARNPAIKVLIGGRDQAKALQLSCGLQLPDDRAIQIDARDDQLAEQLKSLGVNTVIHAAGPFQGQDYEVARAAIAAKANYVDLADGRAFVAGITALDGAARQGGVTVISGASSVPGLSSAVVDRYAAEFGRLDSIRMGIGTGARAPGIATLRGIFGYCGKPIQRLEEGVWRTTHGWLDLQRHQFPAPVGVRLLGSVDVPDLELFPKRYASARTVTLHAGFASALGHLVVWGLAQLVRTGLLESMSRLASPLSRISRWIEPIVSDKGAMFVELKGAGHAGAALTKTWNLVVSSNHGPYIPCGASIALVGKIVAGALPPGAMPCVGLLTVEEYLAPLRALDIREIPA